MSNPTTPQNSHSWVNPKIQIKESAIQGAGYHAVEKIAKDEKLIVQSGQCVHMNAIDTEAMSECWYYGFQVENDIYFYPYAVDDEPYLDGIFKVNHSCEPTAGFNGQITLVALRDIEPGEEITYDYAMTDIETNLEDGWEPQECGCQTESCRKLITGDDWKLPELHKKYRGYFSTHVANSIAAEFGDDRL